MIMHFTDYICEQVHLKQLHLPYNCLLILSVIQLLDINLHVQQVFRGLTQTVFGPGANDKKNPIPSGLQFDPRSRTLVTNGLPGHLQFYSLNLSRQLFNVSAAHTHMDRE